MSYELHPGDCLQIMPTLAAGSVDCICADIPYGTTSCPWDSVIPFAPMWECIRHVIKPRGAVVLFGSQPFTSALVMSNPKWFRYEIVWDKVNKYTNSLNSSRMPLKRHENILIFSIGLTTFNKQMRVGAPYVASNTKGHGKHTQYGHNADCRLTINTGKHNPCSILEIPADVKLENGLHPTQKPVALMAYLIRTYTNPGDTVLDFTMGSGSTGAAALETGRKFIGIEMDAGYFQVATTRLETIHGRLHGLARKATDTHADLPLFEAHP